MRLRVAQAGALLILLGATACQAAPPSAAPPTPPSDSAEVARPTAQPLLAVGAAPAAASPVQPRPTAAPTAVPTSSPSPLDRLQGDTKRAVEDGRRALAAGDYPRAITRLEAVLPAVPADARSGVLLLVGQAQAGDQRFAAALATADTALQASSQPDLQAAGKLLKGQALRGLQRWDEAGAEMRAAADANALVEPAVRLQLAEMWLAAGRPAEAAAGARKGLQSADARLLRINLAETLGRAEAAQQRTEAAMEAYRQLLTAAGSEGYLGEQLYNLAEGAAALGKPDEAIRALRTSIQEFPRARTAPRAVQLLESLGGMRAEDRFYAGIIQYQFWDFKGARANLDAFLQALPDDDRVVEARYYRALATLPAEATQRLLALADAYPEDDYAPMALLEAGKAQEELENYQAAETIYTRLLASYPTRDAGLAGAFRGGLARYVRQDYEGALAWWTELLARDLAPAPRAQALYWTGKARAALGQEDAARAQWQAAAAVRPVDYYVVRATARLQTPPSAAPAELARTTPADEAQLAAWFTRRGLDLEQGGRAAAAEPAYQRAGAMVRYGLFREANWEYEGFLTRLADRPEQLYWLAARFGDLGLPNAQLKLGTAALNAATAEGQVSVLEVPAALQRVAYPLAFPDMAAAVATARGVDPLLFNALMRQESAFDPYAESVMQAKGLTQIMPATGQEIATSLNVTDFSDQSLFQPKRNVEFGAYYFGQRLKRNTRPQRALAAYNAGDGNVDTWTVAGREDPDVFTEYVAFFETQDYVKRIDTYWTLNRYIWGQ